ncbi:hypothetical protein L6R52_11115 [Myxococcota bacterium]|nr:hypothetical protein [Myxococcota bacterium]
MAACSPVVPRSHVAVTLAALCVSGAAHAAPTRAADAIARIRADTAAGKPIVVHTFVALADNDAQGIVPIPRALGDGDAPRTNLYWGARYGVGHFLTRDRGWRRVEHASPPGPDVLERLVLVKTIAGHTTVIVADAWRGARIEAATAAFLRATAGHDAVPITISSKGATSAPRELVAGGAAHVIAWVGHDGLMDFDVPALPDPDATRAARSAIVLACRSRAFFGPPLARADAHALLTTTQLMAPEAYVLDAAIEAWVRDLDPRAVRRAAARAYATYQLTSERAALGVFHAE